MKLRTFGLIVIAAAVLVVAACARATPTPTPVPTATPTATPMATPAPGPTATPTLIPTPTATPTPAAKEAPAPKTPPKTLRVAVFDVPAGVGLGSAQAPVEAMHNYGVGDCLFTCNFEGDYKIPMLATGYTLAPDFSYVDIAVRKGVEFHKGWGEVTAEDWVFTFNDANAATNPTSIHGQAGDFAPYFGEAKLIDRYTFRIPFTKYSIVWLTFLMSDCHQSTTVFSKRAYDEKGEDWMRENMIAEGPFQVVEWKRDDHVYLENAPGTHWRHEPMYDRLEIIEVVEVGTREAMLRAGDIDMADVPIASSVALKGDGFAIYNPPRYVTVLTVVFHGNYWDNVYRTGSKAGEPLPREGYGVHDIPWVGNVIGCPGEGTSDVDGNSPMCKDPGDMEEARLVRWAMALAIDREALNQPLLGGLGAPSGSWESLNPFADYYDADRWGIPYDPNQAKELMAKTAGKRATSTPPCGAGGRRARPTGRWPTP